MAYSERNFRESIDNLLGSALFFLDEAEKQGKAARGILLIGENDKYDIKGEFEKSARIKVKDYSVKIVNSSEYDSIRTDKANKDNAWYSINLDWAEECISRERVIESQVNLVYD